MDGPAIVEHLARRAILEDHFAAIAADLNRGGRIAGARQPVALRLIAPAALIR
jgi:hypothetical protein